MCGCVCFFAFKPQNHACTTRVQKISPFFVVVCGKIIKRARMENLKIFRGATRQHAESRSVQPALFSTHSCHYFIRTLLWMKLRAKLAFCFVLASKRFRKHAYLRGHVRKKTMSHTGKRTGTKTLQKSKRTVPSPGIEPGTFRSSVWRSPNWAISALTVLHA